MGLEEVKSYMNNIRREFAGREKIDLTLIMKNILFVASLLFCVSGVAQKKVNGEIVDNDFSDVSNLLISIGASGDLYVPNNNVGLHAAIEYRFSDVSGLAIDFHRSFYDTYTSSKVKSLTEDRYGVPVGGDVSFFDLNTVSSYYLFAKEIETMVKIKSYVAAGEVTIKVPAKQKIFLGLRGGLNIFQTNYGYQTYGNVGGFGYVEEKYVFSTMKAKGGSIGAELKVLNNVSIKIDDAVSEHEKREIMKYYIDYMYFFDIDIADIKLRKKDDISYNGEIAVTSNFFGTNDLIKGVIRLGLEMKMLNKWGLYYGAEIGARPGLHYNLYDRLYLRGKVGMNLGYKI